MGFIFGSFSPERHIGAPVDTSRSWFSRRLDALFLRHFSLDGRFRSLVSALDGMYCFPGLTTDGVPLIIDSGASVHISPCRDDFITYDECDVTIKDLSSSQTVAGKACFNGKLSSVHISPCR